MTYKYHVVDSQGRKWGQTLTYARAKKVLSQVILKGLQATIKEIRS